MDSKQQENENIINQVVDAIVEQEAAKAPQDKELLRKQVYNNITNKDGGERMERGFKAISSQLDFITGAFAKKQASEELKKASEKLQEYGQKIFDAAKGVSIEEMIKSPSTPPKEIDQLTPDDIHVEPLYNKIGISEETYDLFYQCGRRLYENQSYQEASDAFYLLNFLDATRSNVWLAQGMALQALNEWEQALMAFAYATVFDGGATPLPLVQIAACHIKMGETQLAKDTLQMANELIQANPSLADESLTAFINKLSKGL